MGKAVTTSGLIRKGVRSSARSIRCYDQSVRYVFPRSSFGHAWLETALFTATGLEITLCCS